MIEAVENQGYCPDLAFQMDAETILSFEGTEGATPNINPFKVMFNQLSRGGYIAVGTKDKFAIMDEETGKPTNKPIRSAQLGYELTNTRDNLITLPGGALLSNTAYYLAGMSGIADKTPSNGVEDYTYTQLLRDHFERQGLSFDSAVKSISTIRHLNRTPENPNEALRQTGLWRTSALAVNRIFPEGEYNSEGIITYAALVLMQRIKDAYNKGPQHFLKILEDLGNLQNTIKMLNEKEAPEIVGQQSLTWTSQTNSATNTN